MKRRSSVSVGDLVMFQNCAMQGMTGIISMLSRPSPVAKIKPELRLYWVLCSEGEICFTGGQLVLV
jgi:hypothetical protein